MAWNETESGMEEFQSLLRPRQMAGKQEPVWRQSSGWISTSFAENNKDSRKKPPALPTIVGSVPSSSHAPHRNRIITSAEPTQAPVASAGCWCQLELLACIQPLSFCHVWGREGWHVQSCKCYKKYHEGFKGKYTIPPFPRIWGFITAWISILDEDLVQQSEKRCPTLTWSVSSRIQASFWFRSISVWE